MTCSACLLQWSVDSAALIGYHVGQWRAVPACHCCSGAWTVLPWLAIMLVNDVRCLPVTVTVERGQCCPDWLSCWSMTCGACLSLLQWSVDSAALIGYHVDQWRAVPACHCYSGAWIVLPWLAIMLVNDVRCLPVTVTVERGQCCPDWLSCWSMTCGACLSLLQWSVDIVALIGYHVGQWRAVPACHCYSGAWTLLPWLAIMLVNDVRCLPVTVTVERGHCCPDWLSCWSMTCGACLSLLQWSVDSAALIGYHVGQWRAVPACHCYSGAWIVLPWLAIMLVNDVRCLPVTVTVERGHCCPDWLSCWSMTCGACLSLLQWSVDSAALIGYHVGQWRAVPACHCCSGAWTLLPWLAIMLVNDVRCLPVTVAMERGLCCPDWLSCWSMTCGACLSLLQWSVDIAALIGYHVGQWRAVPACHCCSGAWTVLPWLAIMLVNDVQCLPVTVERGQCCPDWLSCWSMTCGACLSLLQWSVDNAALIGYHVGQWRAVPACHCYSGAWTVLPWLAIMLVNDVRCLPVTVTVERGHCCPDWLSCWSMTCGACLSLLQWSVDSAALIGYHVGQWRAVPACYSGAWTVLPWLAIMLVNDVRCLPVTVAVERGQCCPDWLSCWSMTCGACLSLLQWSVDSAALIGYHVGQWRAVPACHCYSGAWTLLPWLAIMLVNDVRCLSVTVTVERGQCCPDWLSCWSMTCGACLSLLQWNVDSAALIGYHVGQWRAVPVCHCYSGAWTVLPWLAIMLVNDVRCLPVTVTVERGHCCPD